MGGRGGSSHMNVSAGLRGLGPQGERRSAMEALPLTNPNYRLAYQYQINCQRCVWAFEMLRRGYSVEAARSDSSSYEGTIRDIHDFWSSAKNADQKKWVRLDHLADTVRGQYAELEKKMKEWGEGSRAIVANVWKNGGGHIWNAEYINGKVHYYDGQIGQEVDVASRNARTSVLDIFARVDDLDVPDRIMEAVIPKKNKRGKT